MGGRIPYGYRKGSVRGRLLLHPEEARVVRSIFRSYLERKSVRAVARDLAARGVTTREGKRWAPSTLAWILRNETYAGWLRFGGVRMRGRHPRIVSPHVFQRVQTLLDRNGRRPPAGVAGR